MTGTLRQKLDDLLPELVMSVQLEYDVWDQSDEEHGDPEFGFGGICDRVAQVTADVLGENGIDTCPLGAEGGDHAWVAAYDETEAYEVDIPWRIYETKVGGYGFKKIPGVIFVQDHVVIAPIPRRDLELCIELNSEDDQ